MPTLTGHVYIRTNAQSGAGARTGAAERAAPKQALRPRDAEATAKELLAYHQLFQDLFARREQRQWSLLYLRVQLSDIERKTVEPMMYACGTWTRQRCAPSRCF